MDRFLELEKSGAAWKPWRAGLVAQTAGGLWLVKPQTFMNASGDFVQGFAAFYKIGPGDALVVSDDMDLPLGRIRIRKTGSSGGQRGLESVLERLGTKDVPRVRLGIGPRPERVDGADFVLGRFRPEERAAVDDMVERAAAALASACREGVDAAMNAYNASSAA